MSNLLEEAIIDAVALRETAIKSAEAALIEKYKDEFQESLEKIMEEEEVEAPETTDTQAAAELPAGSDANSVAPSTDQQNTEDDAFKDVASSFFDMEGDPDELITIDFDKLVKQEQPNSSPMLASPGMDQTAPPLQEEIELDEELFFEYDQKNDMTNDALYEEELEEELEINIGGEEEESDDELEIDELDEQDVAQVETPEMQGLRRAEANADAKIAAGQAEKGRVQQQKATAIGREMSSNQRATSLEEVDQNAIEEIHSDAQELEEDFDLTEEEIQELAEELKVDLEEENQLRGWMGTTSKEKELQRDVELAKARDDSETKKREQEETRAKDLECKLQESKKQNKQLSFLVEELKDNLISLKEHVEKLSVSNAKLLYINKVFGNNSLNERQKENIVESISNATTVLEAKTIYGTLQSAVQTVSQKKQKESLSEALIHGNTAFISRPKMNVSDDTFSERMRILAGIKSK